MGTVNSFVHVWENPLADALAVTNVLMRARISVGSCNKLAPAQQGRSRLDSDAS